MAINSDTITELALRDARNSVIFALEVDRVSAGSDILENLISQSSLRIDELKGMIAESSSLIDELTPKADMLDYALAASCGLLTGLIDIFLIGKPGESPLGDWTDKQFDAAVKGFAGLCGWNPAKGYEDSLDSAIRFLEKKFPVNYDQIYERSFGQAVKDMSPKNHHIKSLGHCPDLLGLFFFNNGSIQRNIDFYQSWRMDHWHCLF